MRRERMTKTTLSEAVDGFHNGHGGEAYSLNDATHSRGMAVPDNRPVIVTKMFGVEDPFLQEMINNINEAPATPEGILPHQAGESRYPELKCVEEPLLGEDLTCRMTGTQVIESIGNNIVESILEESCIKGRRRRY
jgi:hypothetical protein